MAQTKSYFKDQAFFAGADTSGMQRAASGDLIGATHPPDVAEPVT